jgi:hypothetical protein
MSSEKAPLSMLEAAFRAAERFGVPVVLLAVMIWLLRDAAVTLHSTRDTLGEISTTQSQQAQTMQELAVGQQAIVATQSEIQHAISRPKGAGQEQN